VIVEDAYRKRREQELWQLSAGIRHLERNCLAGAGVVVKPAVAHAPASDASGRTAVRPLTEQEAGNVADRIVVRLRDAGRERGVARTTAIELRPSDSHVHDPISVDNTSPSGVQVDVTKPWECSR
jgi:hypothetical protein